MNIEMALKSRSYILDLDCVRLFFGNFFFLSCLMDRLFYQLSRSTYIFVKNTHQKAANLMFCLILPVAKGPWLFLKVQFQQAGDLSSKTNKIIELDSSPEIYSEGDGYLRFC